jgi:hypothetical protein
MPIVLLLRPQCIFDVIGHVPSCIVASGFLMSLLTMPRQMINAMTTMTLSK